MQNRNRQHNESGYLMLNGPDDTLWIPRSSNSSGKRRQHIHIQYDGLGFIPLNELLAQEKA